MGSLVSGSLRTYRLIKSTAKRPQHIDCVCEVAVKALKGASDDVLGPLPPPPRR